MQRRTLIGGALGAAWAGGAAWAQSSVSEALGVLAPTGKLRVAINYGNAALARRDAATGVLSGVSVDIASELGRRSGLAIVPVPFDAAGKVTAAAKSNVWDVAFLARDPQRALDISFTAAYVVIEGSYAVHRESPFMNPAQVDADGVRIAVSSGSAYDLFLSRALNHAKLFRGANNPEALALFRAQGFEALAGVKQALVEVVAGDPGLRLIAPPFMEINQAMGVPAGRPAAAAYLSGFVEEIKRNGFVKAALARNGQADASVAAPA